MVERAGRRAALGRAVLASLLLHSAVLSSLPDPRDARAHPAGPLRVRVQAAAQSATHLQAPAVPHPPAVETASRAAPRSRRKVTSPRPANAQAIEEHGAQAPSSARPNGGAADAANVAQYRLLVIAHARGARRYPVQAREYGWQGRVDVRVSVDHTGRTESITVLRGSGHAALDAAALEMIREAALRTPAPAALRGQRFAFDVPVIFSLPDPARRDVGQAASGA